MNDRPNHIDGELLQAYLDGGGPEEERAEVEAHLAACDRCAEELEGWQLLFEDLDQLQALSPSQAFGERVMTRLRPATPATRPLRDRILALMPGAGKKGARHPSGRTIQELADGMLAGQELAAAQTHLAACESCRGEVAEWNALAAALAALPLIRPTEGFTGRVMGSFRARQAAAPAPSPRPENRLLAAARALLPTTRKGWIVASSVAAAPAVGLAALMGIVAANPLLTLGDLFAFFGWQAPTLARAGFGRLVQEFVGSPVVHQSYEALQLLLAAPGMLAAAALLTGLVIMTSGWVMYRNVLSHSIPSRHRVRTG